MSEYRIRPFRNSDPPALARLWNQCMPIANRVAIPLSVHELDGTAFGTTCFDREGLLIAEDFEGEPLGFVHASFGPPWPEEAPLRLCYEMGAISMMVIPPTQGDAPWVSDLLVSAERFLASRGAKVFYAGGFNPLNPHYFALYGGSDFGGIADSHDVFRTAVLRAGYRATQRSASLELDLSLPEVKDGKTVLIRRNFRVNFEEDVTLDSWWDSLRIGPHRPAVARLISKKDSVCVAEAIVWSMEGYGRSDGRSRLGLFRLFVHPDHRRRGYGRFLVNEILRAARIQLIDYIHVVTEIDNKPAMNLYQSLKFRQTESYAVYRLPVGDGCRPAGQPLLKVH